MNNKKPDIQDFGISKTDVPYLSRGWALKAQLGLEALLWIIAWSRTPLFAPGVIEVLAGVCFAVPVGILYSRPAIAQGRAAAAKSKQEAGPALFPFTPDEGVREYMVALIGSAVACLVLVGVIYQIYLALGPIEMPLAHFADSLTAESAPDPFPYVSVISTSTAYYFTNIMTVQIRMLAWYNRLPD